MSTEWEYVIQTSNGEIEHEADHELDDDEISAIVEEEKPGSIINEVDHQAPSGSFL